MTFRLSRIGDVEIPAGSFCPKTDDDHTPPGTGDSGDHRMVAGQKFPGWDGFVPGFRNLLSGPGFFPPVRDFFFKT